MITLTALCDIVDIDTAVIERWMATSLILPEPAPTGPLFRDIDVARVRLLMELQGLGIEEDALPIVMSLLDQLYATRDQLRRVLASLQELPPASRDQVLTRLGL
jgi:chaperone modulatory protein CbpM